MRVILAVVDSELSLRGAEGDEAIQRPKKGLDCFAPLAMTETGGAVQDL
jgi:hypothetical protein